MKFHITNTKLPLIYLKIPRTFGNPRPFLKGIFRFQAKHPNWRFISQHPLTGEDPPESFPQKLLSLRADGVINFGYEPLRILLNNLSIPGVNIGGATEPERGAHHVVNDNVLAGRMAQKHFVERHLKHTTFYCQPSFLDPNHPSYNFMIRSRVDGFKEKLPPSIRFHPSPPTFRFRKHREQSTHSEYHRIVAGWLRSLPKPMGIFSPLPGMTHELLVICKLEGFSVPQDFAIITCDMDPYFAKIASLPITNIEFNSNQVGFLACTTLTHLLDQKKQHLPHLQKVKPLPLLSRQSSNAMITDDPLVQEVIHMIERDPTSPPSIDAMAQTLHLSRRTLESRFRKALGKSIHDWGQILKTELAKEHLVESEESLTNIAYQCGFAQQSHFGTVFKKWVGETPKQFRQKFREARA